MPPNMLRRHVFDIRMHIFVLNGYKNQLGSIPDIWKVLQKYNVEEYLQNYLAIAVFPSKYTWKTIVKADKNVFLDKSCLPKR